LEPWFHDPCVRGALARAENYSDGLIAKSTLAKWRRRVNEVGFSLYTSPKKDTNDPKKWMAYHVVSLACLPHDQPHMRCGLAWAELNFQENGFSGTHWAFFSSEWLSDAMKIALSVVRDIFGNPFRPITLNPSWLTPTAFSLATGIYNELAFDRMPILADALQDAGCENEDILTHCRQPGEHVRGCWAVDLLLDKK
jgi:hypothetical protein